VTIDERDARRFRALAEWPGLWQQVENRYSDPHYNRFDDEGDLLDQHDTLAELADGLLKRSDCEDGPVRGSPSGWGYARTVGSASASSNEAAKDEEPRSEERTGRETLSEEEERLVVDAVEASRSRNRSHFQLWLLEHEEAADAREKALRMGMLPAGFDALLARVRQREGQG
jgi:hypothetical protein